jgi:hypothetical protein
VGAQAAAHRRWLSGIVTLSAAVRDGVIDFHGIAVELAYEPFQRDAFAPLFEGFARHSRSNDALRVELSTVSRPSLVALTPEWRPTFCHGLVQGYSHEGAHVLSDGESRIEISPKLGRMFGEVFENATTDLSAGMQHIGLSLLLRERGVFDLHAATACTDTRGLVIIGDSGAGKTTLLLCLMNLGCDFLGDDRLLFRLSDGGTELLAYPREFHLSSNTLSLVNRPPVDTDQASPVAGKYSIYPLQAWPERFRRSWVGRISLVLPHIEDRSESVVRRATAAEAFGKLLASSATVVVDAIGSRPEQLLALKALADAADAYEVALGSDLMRNPTDTARRLLREIDSLASRP